MSAANKSHEIVSLPLVWHMHQPDYRDPTGVGDMLLPWVRLHSCRAYTDMAWLLEKHPAIHATVSISPVLADQIDDLAHGRCGDRFLDLSMRPAEDLSHMDRVEILRSFFMVDWEHNVRPLQRYWYLLHKRGRELKTVDLDKAAARFTNAEMRDLQVLFNLVWMGAMARETEPVVQNLLRKGQDFTEIEKSVLLETQEKLVSKVLPRWRALAARGQVELCTTPYYHAILPLLADTDCARESAPDSILPERIMRPNDVRIHIERALEAHRRHFGFDPKGFWPSEGSVSQNVAGMISSLGLEWIGSDEAVLQQSKSLKGPPPTHNDHLSPWNVETEEGKIAIFFRDRLLSDLVSFSYSANPPSEAAEDLIARILRLHHEKASKVTKEEPGQETLVTLILDGENPWEFYKDSGRRFLEEFYKALTNKEHDGTRIITTTPAKWLSNHRPPRSLYHLHAGSWVDAGFRVWIGHKETNKAWSLLRAAGQILDTRGKDLAPENREEALNHLMVAEGSDWTWWYGDDFSTETRETFDALFRARLLKIYELTGESTPPDLRRPISSAAASGQRIVLLREPWSLITPVINGKAAPYLDWQGAGVYRPGQHLGRMYRSTSQIEGLHYGCDPTELYVRLDLNNLTRVLQETEEILIQLLAGDREIEIILPLVLGSGHGRVDAKEPGKTNLVIGKVCVDDIIEAGIPFEPLELPGGETLFIAIKLLAGDVELERLPRYGHLKVRIPRLNLQFSNWQA